MNFLISYCAALLFSISLPAEGKLSLTITNIKESKGELRIAVYRPSDNFLEDEGSYKYFVVDAKAPETTYEVSLPQGEYAVALVHDLNGNEEMDRNMLGIPKEPYGISRNPAGKFSKPSYKDASFRLGESKHISIEMKTW